MTDPSDLSDSDLAELDGFLAQVEGGKIPNSEALDGFLAAIACCPDLVTPEEYMDVLLDGEAEDGEHVFETAREALRFGELVNRHWNHVTEQLTKGEIYVPLIHKNELGVYAGNDWANGFLTGTRLRHSIWSELFSDEENGGSVIPIMALAYEHDPDPEMRPYKEPIDDEKRERLIIGAAAGVMRMHTHFLTQGSTYLPESGTFISRRYRVGRNDPCPCGSGKKYKRCCGQEPTMH